MRSAHPLLAAAIAITAALPLPVSAETPNGAPASVELPTAAVDNETSAPDTQDASQVDKLELPPLPEFSASPIPSVIRLSLHEAIELAIKASPSLKAAQASTLAAEGSRNQAGLWSNPEVGFKIENFGGEKSYEGMDGAEVTYSASQVIELGGKRSNRQQAEEHAVFLGLHNEAMVIARVRHDTTVAYMNTVAAELDLELLSEQLDVATDLLDEVNERVSAAREPLIQRSKAEITVSTAKFAHARAKREVAHARSVLASLLGNAPLPQTLKVEEFTGITEPMSDEQAVILMESSPAVSGSKANIQKKQAEFEYEKSNAIPDLTLELGVRDFRDEGTQALVAGFSIPLPVLNQNQGAIEKARREVEVADAEGSDLELTMHKELHEALHEQRNSFDNVGNIQNQILPAAEKAFRLSREGYSSGRLAYLEVLDAQRTLFEVKSQRISALKDYHAAKASVEKLTTGENPARTIEVENDE